MAFNLPNLLTWQRILAIPLLVCVYLVPFDAWGEHSRNLVATILFILASLTDWLDGWLARRLGQQTELGAFLDPVADKLLVCVALVMLLDLGRINAGIAIIIIGREITISALREWMASIGARKSVAVNWMGKVKTAVQMLAIPMLLYHDPIGSFDCQYWGSWMITLAAIQTFISMAYYLKQAWPQLRATRAPTDSGSAVGRFRPRRPCPSLPGPQQVPEAGRARKDGRTCRPDKSRPIRGQSGPGKEKSHSSKTMNGFF